MNLAGKWLLTAEFVLGVLATGFGLTSVWSAYHCSGAGVARDCAGWAMLSLMLFLPVGLLLLTACAVCIVTRRWLAQWIVFLAGVWIAIWISW